ncbi:MAG TPA: gliding motility-associated C-terminal domain-containing protein [Flavobacteriales bacterium]|nr:gliding motility-associated C-terminal domain-containing protein [Flavobacteriales bacterium]HRP81164.1 gliding motility-associated C-terminal domain-containing protein [Flavobacteriales bacterium]
MMPRTSWRKTIAVALLAATTHAHAEHIIGGELYYDHLGADQYRITLTLYRDCAGTGAAFDALGNITIFSGTGTLVQLIQVPYMGSTFVPVELDSPCLNLPPNLCIETTSYITTVTLPPSATGYQVSYQRCCRQPSILNLVGPASAGLTCTTRIPPQPDQANSSPRFNSLPPVALCLGEPVVFDHSATDPDGDQLVYALATPYTGGSMLEPYPAMSTPPPYTPVAWSAGYSGSYQINSQPPMAIDPSTGVLTVQPAAIGNYVIAISAKEYRNGVLLSETIRDFLFSVVACNATVDAIIAPQTQFCTGDLTVNFSNVGMGGHYWHWDFGDPDALADTSSASNPTWTYPGPGTYTVTLVANPGLGCTDTAQAIFALYPTPDPSFLVPGPACGAFDTVLTALGNFGPDASIHWSFGPNATPPEASVPQVNVAFGPNGPHPITLTVEENGCTGTFSATVATSTVPQPFFSANPEPPQPVGTDILFSDLTSLNGAQIASVYWMLDDSVVQHGGAAWLWNNAAPGTHTVTLTYVTQEGCTVSYAITYVVRPEEVVIPNVFSPNNDGPNDAFTIVNAEYYNNSLNVYNRWGQVVFHATNYRNRWRAHGLPDGTYYYVFRLDDGREFTGHITVLR